MRTFNDVSSEGIRQFVNYWNDSFPVDYWWRIKHGVAFNSVIHQQSCFIDQLIEFHEEESYQKAAKAFSDKKADKKYEPGRMNWLKPKVYTDSEIQNMFDNMDLDKL